MNNTSRQLYPFVRPIVHSAARSTFLFICLTVCLASCTGDKKGTTSAKPNAQFSLENSLVAKIPGNAFGFFEWNSTGEAYKRLEKSPWMGDDSLALDQLAAQKEILKNVLSTLKEAGIDPNLRSTWSSLFSRSIAFVAPGTNLEEPIVFAIYFQSDKSINLDEKLSQFKTSLSKAGPNVQDKKISQGKAFEANFDLALSVDIDQPPKKLFVGWNGQNGVIASSLWLVEDLLANKYNALPELVKTDLFKKSTTGYPGEKSLVAFGYADLNRVLSEASAEMKKSGLNNVKAETFPFQTISWATSMTDVPHNDFRIAYAAVDKQQQQWFDALGSSASGSLMPAMPENPLLFVSLDGPTLKRMKELAFNQLPGANPELQQRLKILDNLKRMGIVIRVAPPGQSILPVPDLMVVMETDNPGATNEQLTSLIGELAQGAGGAGSQMQWTDDKIDDQSIKSMMSPLGFGAFMTSHENLVIITSSKPHLKRVLRTLNGKAKDGGKGLPPKIQTVLAKEKTLSNFYVNFQEVGTLMQNMGGLLQMYAPQNPDAKALFEAKNIANLKKMGHMVGTITHQKGIIGFRSFYQKGTAEKIALKKK